MALEDNDFSIPVLLDSGTTYTYVPQATYKKLASEVGVRYMSGSSVVKCSLKKYNGTVDFAFSGYEIHVPFNELVVDAYDIYGDPILFENGDQLCFFGIFPDISDMPSTFVLGDTFLRSAYVVYDLDNAEISLANIHFNVTDRYAVINEQCVFFLAQLLADSVVVMAATYLRLALARTRCLMLLAWIILSRWNSRAPARPIAGQVEVILTRHRPRTSRLQTRY